MSLATPALIDILSLIEQHAHITLCGRSTRHYKNGVEYHSDCPWCNGKDRFVIWPDVGRYYCRVCNRYGDAINFLRDYCDMTYHQACQELDIDPRYPEETLVNLPQLYNSSKDEPPPKKWMETAESFLYRASRYLWSDGGKRGLDYLHGRGLTDDTIRAARLGFCPDWFSESFINWGLSPDKTDQEAEIKIPEGIVIPWFVDDQVWKLSVRRPDKSYYQVLGSADALYNSDTLRPTGCSVLLFESEFDALSAMQEAGDLAACIATGGAAKGRTNKCIAILKKASHVLLAFDTDEAGDHGAQEWLNVLPQAFRWLPWSHDCNDMLKQGLPIRLWVEQGLQTAHVEIPQKIVEIPTIPQEIPTETTEILTPTPAVPKQEQRDRLPSWLDPDTYDWKRQVERNGLEEMMERRAAWYAQQDRSVPSLPLKWRMKAQW